MSTEVKYKQDGPIGRITFTSPKGVNVFSTKVLEALEARLDEAAKSPDLRVLILTGDGKTFVAGADIAEMSSSPADVGKAFSQRGQRGMDRVANFEQAVTIAAINGVTFGGGCELAAACDLRIMAKEAKIGVPEVRLGLIPGWGGTQRLRLIVGPGMARELVYTGEPLTGDQAERIGLVNKAVPAAELMQAVDEMAKKIIAVGPYAVRMAKRAFINADAAWLEKGLLGEAEAFGEAFGSPQGREGLKAFLEKRAADWSV